MQKLIEAALPLSSINRKTVSEKKGSQGSPVNLHMWWGRSPRYSTRAALLSSLIDISEDPEELSRRYERVESNSYTAMGDKPTVFDPFSGFGGIPLVAQELGLPVIAGDLNSVAVMLTKAATEIPARFEGQCSVNPCSLYTKYQGAKGLAEDVQYYGEWMRDQAEEKLRSLYPNEPEGKPAAWLWARTVKCPNPACCCHIPMASSFVINSKAGHEAWVEPVAENGTVHFILHEGKCPKDKETNKFRNYGARFCCPACGEITTDEYVKKMGIDHKLATQLMAVVVDTPAGKIYKAPNRIQEDAAIVSIPEDVPQGEIPDNAHWFSPPGFGLTEYADLFTPRQLTMLTVFCDLLKEVQERAASDALTAGFAPTGGSLSEGGNGALAYGQAVSIYLAFVIDKIADRNSTICSWNSSGGNQRATFCRQSMPMVWNYAEGNPFSTITGNFMSSLQNVVEAIKTLPCSSQVTVYQGDALTAKFPEKALVCTEIPYYSSIGYAHLSDFFYIWMRRSLKPVFPELFNPMVTSKEELTTVGQYYGRTQKECEEEYRGKLWKIIEKLYQCADPAYPSLFFYEYRKADQAAIQADSRSSEETAWEAMLKDLLQAGFAINAVWPLRSAPYTEKADSTRVLISARKAEKTERITRRGFITTLKRELPGKLQKAYLLGVDPWDRDLVGMGCGLSVFSRYKSIMNADGSEMCVGDALPIIYQETQDYIRINFPDKAPEETEMKEDTSDAGKL